MLEFQQEHTISRFVPSYATGLYSTVVEWRTIL